MRVFGRQRAQLYALLAIALIVSPLLSACSERPLPTPEITDITFVEANGDTPSMFVVAWEPVKDRRVEGYAIYRAEQGLGPTTGAKSGFTREAVTIALQYKDDELRVTERFPRTQYFYRIAAISENGEYGPLSEEMSVVYDPSES